MTKQSLGLKTQIHEVQNSDGFQQKKFQNGHSSSQL